MIAPKNSGVEVCSLRKAKSAEVLVESGPKATYKGTFCKAVKELLRVFPTYVLFRNSKC